MRWSEPKSRFCLVANSARARLRRERGPHIDRHLMGRCRPSLSQIVGGHTYDDTRRCGGPTGLKRRQQRRSHGFLHGFGAFSQRDAAHLLPRFFQPNVRLLCPFFLRGFVAGLCVAAELGLLFPKLPQKGQSRPSVRRSVRRGGDLFGHAVLLPASRGLRQKSVRAAPEGITFAPHLIKRPRRCA